MPRGNKRRTDQKRIHDTTGQWRTVSNAFGEPSISPVEALAENAYIAQKSQRLIIPTSSKLSSFPDYFRNRNRHERDNMTMRR